MTEANGQYGVRMKDLTHAGGNRPPAGGGRRLALALTRVRVALRTLLRLTDRGGWVAPGVLGCAYPRKERAIATLSERGIQLLVNLHVRPHEPEHLKWYGLREVHLPVKDFAAPSPSQIDRGVRAILEARAVDERVAVHCGGGLGRTGTLLACYLAKAQGLGAEQALRRVRALRPGSVETPEQAAAVVEWTLRHTRPPND